MDNPDSFPHHRSVSQLWSTKWRMPCTKNIYPFMDGNIEDFDPIFGELVKRSNDSIKILYDPDAYAEPFLPVGDRLFEQAEEAEKAGDVNRAKEFFLRAGAVYRIARFPIIRSKLSKQAWESNKAAYLRGGKYLDPPNQVVNIPFKDADTSAGDKSDDIPVYVRVPNGDLPATGWPVLLFICGIDAYRTDHTPRTDWHIRDGFATVSVEIPGTGDCPANANDPKGVDRLWTSVLDWIASVGKDKFRFDPRKVFARGISTGGYAGIRIAHTHADRLAGAIGQGGYSHHALSPEWIRCMNHMEYPYAMADAFAIKNGYRDVDDILNSDAQKRFSLLQNGILDMPCCRLLLINGMLDSIFPIEDSMLVAARGRAKDVRFVAQKYHMGNPGGEKVLMDWLKEVLAEGDQGVKTFTA
jgi:hypothetical protein